MTGQWALRDSNVAQKQRVLPSETKWTGSWDREWDHANAELPLLRDALDDPGNNTHLASSPAGHSESSMPQGLECTASPAMSSTTNNRSDAKSI